MSSLSLAKPRRITILKSQSKASGLKIDALMTVPTSDQDRSAAAQVAISPAVFWKVVMVLAMALFVYNAIGTALLGSDWLFAYWNTWNYWCAGGYCR